MIGLVHDQNASGRGRTAHALLFPGARQAANYYIAADEVLWNHAQYADASFATIMQRP
ncbi:MAG: hypothetical protein JO193_06400 [Candidatus Eremiobacteraeota bacterium]|nr:hypothetical protein [Candidatus Eremiobacteraeota bacterium]